ncbi:MAG TPA: carbon monoxide dehydrogenase [Chloroflexi bacterium]|jgi:carbon-monoxide dehydrogenase large subunit|nr:carbon monoxide dehydrogenase [Chloroflexota bacterium]
MAIESPSPFGQAILRREDRKFITGSGNFVDDIRLPEMAYVAILRSPHGHAAIRSINVAEALALPSVLTVVTGADVKAAGIGAIPCGWTLPDMKVPVHSALATDKVRFQGDAVAAVVADSRAACEDALELIEVDYEVLPAVVDPETAVAGEAPLVHDEIADNISFRWTVSGGDVDAAFRDADRVIEQRLLNQRLIPNAIEPRAAIAQYDEATGDLTLWTSSQIPHLVRLLLALTINHPENHLRVISPDVGGAFGSKLYFYPEEAIVSFLAKRLPGTPVKWVPTRSEDYLTTTHGRDHVDRAAFAVMNDGTITGVRVTTVANLGAYLSTFAPGIPTILFGLMLSGNYKIANIHCEVIGALTNTVMVDAYRGAGRPEATYVVERMIDLVADELGMDPADVRRKNFIGPDEFPYTTPTGVTYDSGKYTDALDKALQTIGYREFRTEQEQARKSGRLLGIGMASYVEICGMAPSQVLGAVGGGAGGWESANVRVHPTGKVTVYSGACWHGQGHDTGFAQIVAGELGVPMEDIEIIHGDTEKVQFGIGTFGSRSSAVGGIAAYLSAQKVKEKARRIAAHLLEAPLEDVVYEDGKCFVQGSPGEAKTLADISLAAYLAHNYPSDLEPGLEETTFYDPSNFTWPFGTHVCSVEVDPDTGTVKILKYLAVDDCGRVINPMLKDGQVHGGIAQGIAQALYEHAVYNAEGALLTGSMVDYAIPGASELPMFQTDETVTPSPVNPLGIKGIGEAGTIGSTACVVNAVLDALKPRGIRHIDMPLSQERVWRALNGAQP